jgi:hypothetical protein
MGIKDRLVAAKRYVWSPMTLTMLERGSDTVVKAGHTARVVVDVEGESDGTAERIEVRLKLGEHMSWPVADVPTTAGRHELEVLIPADAPPTSRYSTYYWVGKLHRTRGIAAEAMCPVRVIGHPDHVYWPDGPHRGSEEPGVLLDQDTVNAGGAVSGRAPGAESVEVGHVLDVPEPVEGSNEYEQTQRFTKVADVRPGADGTFRLEIPAGVPPTLYNGDRTWITWEVRTTAGAWQRFAVLDPDGRSEVPELKSSLSDLIT